MRGGYQYSCSSGNLERVCLPALASYSGNLLDSSETVQAPSGEPAPIFLNSVRVQEPELHSTLRATIYMSKDTR